GAGKISLLIGMGPKAHPDVPADVPLSLDLTRTPLERQMLELKFSAYDVGYAFMAPPETPPERVAALRAAMTASVNDPAFRADAVREKIEVDPVAGVEVEAIIRSAYAAPPEVLTRLNQGDQTAAVAPAVLLCARHRHARPWAGHPRLSSFLMKQDVDGRDKPGHDDGEAQPRQASLHLICIFSVFSTARSK